ncbi:MAG: regulator of amino acid metabolism, contains ACT domain protein [Candidatus Methanomethylophilaceae archaeon]
MDILDKVFKGFPSQEKVISEMIRSGIRVINGTAYCNNIEISDSALGRAANVDRRVVRATLEKIDSHPRLKSMFSKMISISLMSDIASEMGLTTIEIIPENANEPGILSDISATVYRAGIVIRQAVVIDDARGSDPRLILVLDGNFPSEYLPALRACRGVKTVILR